MPTVTIRLSEQERAALQAAASRSGQTLSAYVRETLGLSENRESLDWAHERIAGLERRMDALERLAHQA
jgi:predicted DNA-binding protein